jgi:hypothetical protein
MILRWEWIVKWSLVIAADYIRHKCLAFIRVDNVTLQDLTVYHHI